MYKTVFDTPIIKPFLQPIARSLFKLNGWKIVDRSTGSKKYILIGAPHTSNWDFPMFLLIMMELNLKAYWLGKHTLFNWPFGALFHWLGGLPVDRTRSTNIVQQCVDYFAAEDALIIANTPEGTRSRVDRWKTGFYHIATGAGIPIALGYLDYRKKEGGIAGLFQPTGDIDADMKTIKAFYRNVSGKHSHRYDKT
ncbi:MAG: lysophospholipid acyltransferase family protein [Deltaproteobacteria bacterium]|nr:lysophospholipid acyltransferase family protein [Deltaproteobacteria bacterium]